MQPKLERGRASGLMQSMPVVEISDLWNIAVIDLGRRRYFAGRSRAHIDGHTDSDSKYFETPPLLIPCRPQKRDNYPSTSLQTSKIPPKDLTPVITSYPIEESRFLITWLESRSSSISHKPRKSGCRQCTVTSPLPVSLLSLPLTMSHP